MLQKQARGICNTTSGYYFKVLAQQAYIRLPAMYCVTVVQLMFLLSDTPGQGHMWRSHVVLSQRTSLKFTRLVQ